MKRNSAAFLAGQVLVVLAVLVLVTLPILPSSGQMTSASSPSSSTASQTCSSAFPTTDAEQNASLQIVGANTNLFQTDFSSRDISGLAALYLNATTIFWIAGTMVGNDTPRAYFNDVFYGTPKNNNSSGGGPLEPEPITSFAANYSNLVIGFSSIDETVNSQFSLSYSGTTPDGSGVVALVQVEQHWALAGCDGEVWAIQSESWRFLNFGFTCKTGCGHPY
jgi:hypothetical protein